MPLSVLFREDSTMTPIARSVSRPHAPDFRRPRCRRIRIRAGRWLSGKICRTDRQDTDALAAVKRSLCCTGQAAQVVPPFDTIGDLPAPPAGLRLAVSRMFALCRAPGTHAQRDWPRLRRSLFHRAQRDLCAACAAYHGDRCAAHEPQETERDRQPDKGKRLSSRNNVRYDVRAHLITGQTTSVELLKLL